MFYFFRSRYHLYKSDGAKVCNWDVLLDDVRHVSWLANDESGER